MPTDPTPPTDPPAPVPVPPDLLAWARQTFDLEEFEEQVRQMQRSGGGKQLDDFIGELEAAVRGS